jgi:hypothetical protein
MFLLYIFICAQKWCVRCKNATKRGRCKKIPCFFLFLGKVLRDYKRVQKDFGIYITIKGEVDE